MIKHFGRQDGQEIRKATLESDKASIAILNYGGVVQDWRIDYGGRALPMVLGFSSFDDYPEHSRSFGIIAGRVANRTSNARFELQGKTYELSANKPPNHLHGGHLGLGRRIWEMDTDQSTNSVILSYHSPHGEEGYPGEVAFQVTYRLDGPRLTMTFTGQPDQATPINLCNHNYYNLNGAGDIRRHSLQIRADRYTATDEALIPTGEVADVEGTPFDFREAKTFEAMDPAGQGVDTNLCLSTGDGPAVDAVGDETGVRLQVWTDQPGVQLFNAAKMQVPVPGLERQTYGPFAGFCVEAQHWPDALNNPEFPSIISDKDQPYFQKLEIEIGG